MAAKNAGLADRNGDGYIDDYDVALKNLDTQYDPTKPWQSSITAGEFTSPYTGKSYDPDLWTEIDNPLGHLNGSTGNLPNGTPKPWAGYDDGVLDNRDGYAKVNGQVKVAITQAQWKTATSGWAAYGDGGGTHFQDEFEGPVIPSDPTLPPVQFATDFSSELSMTPQSFDTSAFNADVPNQTATVTTSGSTKSIANGTLTAAMANGGTATEHFPSSVTSGWQATYTRPVFQNVTFNNVRIPQGLNAKFINCTFNGYTYVKMNTNITKAGTSTTTSDPNDGMNWAKQMTSGSFSANTALTASNSTAFTQGNNLHFTGCTFNGVTAADTPTAYTHFANSWEFDGTTVFNDTVDQSVTIMAPNTNIEMGGYVDPAANPSTLVGVVVAGNIDIRGTAVVDGSLIVTGNGAGNTTLGYFGSTDSGQAVPRLTSCHPKPTASTGI